MRTGLTILALGALTAMAPPSGDADLTLRPVAGGGAVSAVDVTIDLRVGKTDGFALTAPVVYPGATGVADRMTGITVTDAGGTVPLRVSEDAPVPGGFPYFRHWKATRAVRYPLRIAYRALVQPPGGPGGPAFGIRAVAGGIAGAGSTLLLLPDDDKTAATHVRWDLSAMPAGSIASTSFGDGPAFTMKGGPETLTGGWLIAGPAARYPASGSADGFSAAWLGTPPFDAPAEMAWTAHAYGYLARHFPHLKPTPPYRVFMQFRDAPPYGGATALEQSFMLSRGPAKPDEPRIAPRATLFHEMIHQWVGGIAMPMGVSSWFSEGLTTYYQDVLPMRGGFDSVADYGKHINALAEEYFTSKARNWSAVAITKVGFGDEEVRHTPYRRGALYFHDLDARIRAHSGGRRNLESLLFPMFLARDKGATFDEAAWLKMVTGELGAGEAARFRRLILDGTDTLEPRADAFGPCFTRQPTTFTKEGKAIPGFRWVRVARVADSRCRGR